MKVKTPDNAHRRHRKYQETLAMELLPTPDYSQGTGDRALPLLKNTTPAY